MTSVFRSKSSIEWTTTGKFYTLIWVLLVPQPSSQGQAFLPFFQYQRRGIGELVLKNQHQLVLKYQQDTPLVSAGMPLWLGLNKFSPSSVNQKFVCGCSGLVANYTKCNEVLKNTYICQFWNLDVLVFMAKRRNFQISYTIPWQINLLSHKVWAGGDLLLGNLQQVVSLYLWDEYHDSAEKKIAWKIYIVYTVLYNV